MSIYVYYVKEHMEVMSTRYQPEWQGINQN